MAASACSPAPAAIPASPPISRPSSGSRCRPSPSQPPQSCAACCPRRRRSANPLDYTSLIWAERERLAAIAEALGNDPAISQLLVFHDTPAGLTEETRPGWEATRRGLADGAERSAAAPLFSSTLPDLIGEEEILELDGRGIAAVQGLGTAMRCVAALRRKPGDPARLREIAAAAAGRSEAGPWLGEAEAKALLESAGVPVPERRIAVDAEDAARQAAELRGPVVLKLSSPTIQHKSDVGALALGVEDPETVAAEARRLLSLPVADGAELLVERMAADPGAELIVAARGDAVVPALVIGIGGIWTEILEDVAVIPLPADAERIRASIEALRGAPLLHGARGSEPVDIAAVAAAAARIGELASAERLALLEVNPLLATAEGALALDAVARR